MNQCSDTIHISPIGTLLGLRCFREFGPWVHTRGGGARVQNPGHLSFGSNVCFVKVSLVVYIS